MVEDGQIFEEGIPCQGYNKCCGDPPLSPHRYTTHSGLPGFLRKFDIHPARCRPRELMFGRETRIAGCH